MFLLHLWGALPSTHPDGALPGSCSICVGLYHPHTMLGLCPDPVVFLQGLPPRPRPRTSRQVSSPNLANHCRIIEVADT